MAEDKLVAVNEISSDEIRNRIYTIRGVQVMIDSDLAQIYGYSTTTFNQQVKNNIEKFDEDFRFQLTVDEYENLISKNLTSRWGGRRKLPYAFTEQGIYMLMTVLRGELATRQSKALIRLFKQMKEYINDNALVFDRLNRIELKQLEADKNFKEIFKKLEEPREKKAVIFSDGQLWNAASCIEEIFKKAKRSITIIDKYVDNKTLDLLSKKKEGVSVVIFTDSSCATLTETDIENFNKQYGKLEVKYYKKCHARYIILDNKILYHCGASLKDAGKQMFSIDLIDEPEVLKLLKETVAQIK